MSLNIKNKDAHKLANQLAKLTGENMTEAVTNALRERLDRVRSASTPTVVLVRAWLRAGNLTHS